MRKWIAILLVVSLCASLAACGQSENIQTEAPATEAAQTEVPTTEATHIFVDSYLDGAQVYMGEGNFASAVTLLEQAQAISEDDRIAAMLAQIDAIWLTDLEPELFTTAEHLKSGTVTIHSISVQERAAKAIRYTVNFSATAGMRIHLVSYGLDHYLDHYLDHTTTGQQETVVFEIASQDIQRLEGFLGMQIGTNDEDFYYVETLLPFPNEETPEVTAPESPKEFEVAFRSHDALVGGTGRVETVTVKDMDDRWQFILSHSLPDNLTATVYLWSNGTRDILLEEPNATNAAQKLFQFDITKEVFSRCTSINISFGSQETGDYGAYIQLPFQILKTDGVPMGDPVRIGYSLEDQLTSASCEVYDVTAQRLDNGFIRFLLDIAFSQDMTCSAFLHMDPQDPSKNLHLADFVFSQGRNQYILDIPEMQLAESQYAFLYAAAESNDQDAVWIDLSHAPIMALTAGTPLSEPIALDCRLSEAADPEAYQVHSCTAQLLDNGYIRYAVTSTFPPESLCHFFDSRSDGREVNVWYTSGPESQEETFLMDIQETATKSSSELVLFANLVSDQIGAIFVIDNGPIADSDILPVSPVSVTLLDPAQIPATEPLE